MPPVAETYDLRDTAGANDVARLDAEVKPTLHAATYATGMSVTSQRATKDGTHPIVQQSPRWPRRRELDRPSSAVRTLHEFVGLVEVFVRAWPAAGEAEKALLLVTHRLDSLSCWSMEDLYLSATTQLQVIVATEAARQPCRTLLQFSPHHGENSATAFRSPRWERSILYGECCACGRFADVQK
ncbi:hypothetical protein [Burkholderia cenocepacia]|uniref:hypothetical protein n=1 Tax=Burkholderia cenocepacia TaxID=95486 RepID=UPI000F5A6FEA|nr:hypothetical protein [Burkholderia cenocepacia]MCW3641246.1 hypothetical protein [Burkholderia cenocepacia]